MRFVKMNLISVHVIYIPKIFYNHERITLDYCFRNYCFAYLRFIKMSQRKLLHFSKMKYTE